MTSWPGDAPPQKMSPKRRLGTPTARRVTAKRTHRVQVLRRPMTEADQTKGRSSRRAEEEGVCCRAALAARLEELEVEKTATTTAKRTAAKRYCADTADTELRTSRARRAAS